MDEEDDKVKLISWNVNGLRAVVGKGFVDIFQLKHLNFLPVS